MLIRKQMMLLNIHPQFITKGYEVLIVFGSHILDNLQATHPMCSIAPFVCLAIFLFSKKFPKFLNSSFPKFRRFPSTLSSAWRYRPYPHAQFMLNQLERNFGSHTLLLINSSILLYLSVIHELLILSYLSFEAKRGTTQIAIPLWPLFSISSFLQTIVLFDCLL